jgi:hypothetical protein
MTLLTRFKGCVPQNQGVLVTGLLHKWTQINK